MNFENCVNYEEDETSDGDTCTDQELQALFNKKGELLISMKVLAGKKYIMHLNTNKETDPSVIVSCNDSVDLFKFTNSKLTKTFQLPLPHENECVDAKFAPCDNNMVYVACSKANVKLYDLRTPKKHVIEFIDSTVNDDGDMKTFLSFDVASDNKFVAVGTVLFDADAFILFWDVRNANLLGGYWESHTDDIIQLKFHPEDRNKLLSGSTDGLINMYNLTKESEDDALTECLNTESSVEQIAWCEEDVFCGTHTHDVQMWRLQDATPYGDYKRELLSQTIKRKSDDHSYVAGCLTEKKLPVLLIGSNFKDGECLRGLRVKGNALEPLFDLQENTQRVRATNYNDKNHILMTGGEKGILDIWKLLL